MAGPAAAIWQQRFGRQQLADSLESALAGAATLLTGTGWASDLEHRARARASELGIFSIAVIDHWVNYEQRFQRDGTTVLPAQFWVTDPYALQIARRCFPGADIRLQPNLYLQEQLAAIAPVASAPDTLLYALEPARDTWGRAEPGEFQALNYLVERLPGLGLPAGIALRLRPHPSDAPGKYRAWIAAHAGMNCALDTSPTLAAALNGARWVAGCESYALVVALHAQRGVYCTLPPWAPAFRLPHAGIIQLRQLPP